MFAIIHAELVMRDHLIPEEVLFVEDGKIAGHGEMRNTPIPEDCEILDAEGAYVGPGLVDIHCHTGGEHQFWQEPEKAAKFHQPHGITTVLATPNGRLSVENFVLMHERVRKAMATEDGASIVDAFRVASYNPARAVGFTDRGEIRVGLRADLVMVDHMMHVKTVILGGNVQKFA